jgi:hypothetical protein
MLIEVTQEHIDRALQRVDVDTYDKCYECPVALALKDRFQVKYIFAGYSYLQIGRFPEDNIYYTLAVPQDVSLWESNFDNGNPVQPFSFELDLGGTSE